MTLRDHVAALVGALPPEASVTLPAATLRGWLEEDGAPTAPDVVDLTVGEAGELLDRSASTVRDYARAGLLPGAYRQRGREWRVPRAAIDAFRRAEAAPPPVPAPDAAPADLGARGETDLGAWRRERRAATGGRS